MRTTIGLTFCISAHFVLAWGAFAQPAGPPNSASRQSAMLPYYPAAARAAGVEGEAVLTCARSGGGALTDCAVVSEAPADQGFGRAALDIAGHTEDRSTFPGVASPPLPITFKFHLNPPSITPPVLETPHVVFNPDWAAIPSAGDVQRLFPVQAYARHMTGRAVLSCRLDVEGKTTECTTTEDPPGWGFGEAALKLAKVFKFRPTRVDDVPVAGGKMVVPINFTYPHR